MLDELVDCGASGRGDQWTWADALNAVWLNVDEIAKPVPDIEQERQETKILRQIIEVYGIDHQTDKFIEELSEAIQASIKFRQSTQKERCQRYHEFLAEIADVGVMIDQMKLIYDADMEIKKIRAEKLDRQLERMAQGEGT